MIMTKWPIWKRARLLWGLLAVCGVVVTLGSILPLLATVHAGSRTNQRLSDIEKMKPDQPISVADYKAACEDAEGIGETHAKLFGPLAYVGGFIVLLASWGSRMNRRIREIEEEPQQRQAD